MYRKFIDSHTLEAPPKTYRAEGVCIFNFDTDPDAMAMYHYYPVYPDPSVPEGQQVSAQSTFTLVPRQCESAEDVERIVVDTDAETGERTQRTVVETVTVRKDCSYITAEWVYEDIPVPSYPERDEAELMIARSILKLAAKYDAVAALATLDNLSIPGLMALAAQYHVTDEDLHGTETDVLILTRQLEAVTGLSWSDAWDGLKSRLPGYFQQIAQQQQEA